MYTRVGTERYMPPEMLEHSAYKGTSADLFASGVILFVMVTGFMPTYQKAESNDYFYQFIKKNKIKEYWEYLEKVFKTPMSVFSADFKDLVMKMLHFFYDKRPEIKDIKEHAWYKGPTATIEEVRQEFTKRRELARKKASENGEGDVDMEEYEDQYNQVIQRGDEDELEEDAVLIKRRCAIYNPIAAKKTKFFSKYPPKVILGALCKFIQAKQTKMDVSKKKYKVKATLTTENEQSVEVAFNIMKVIPGLDPEKIPADSDEENDLEEEGDEDQENTYCIEWRKKKGDHFEFLSMFNQFQEEMQLISNAPEAEEAA